MTAFVVLPMKSALSSRDQPLSCGLIIILAITLPQVRFPSMTGLIAVYHLSLAGNETVIPIGIARGKIKLRKRHDLLVLAVRRGEGIITGVGGETRIEAGDSAIIYATPEDITKGAGLFTKQKNK